MTVYLGKNQVGVGRVVEKKVAKEKFGVTVDSFLGDVDADGNYVLPSEPVEINLAGIKSVPNNGFVYRFSGIRNLVVNANDVVSVGSEGFKYAFTTPNTLNSDSLYVSFDSLEFIDSPSVFEYACQNRSSFYNKTSVSFKKLKKIAANNAFQYFGNQIDQDFDVIFPSLEEISGNSVFNSAFRMVKDDVVTFSKIKKITGGNATYTSTFGGFYVQNTIWNFPSATEFTGYVWNVGSSYAGEIHFAAANQAAIEACEGYSYKWGFQNATIYFDL